MAQQKRPWSRLSVLQCAITPQKKTHIRKLFHVLLNRIVGYRICFCVETEKASRSTTAIAFIVEEIEVL
jgi:hypothetical protein